MAELAAADELQGCLVLGEEAHHEGGAQPNAGLSASGDQGFGVGHGQAERLFAKDMLAGLRAGECLLAMHIGRRGDIDRVKVAAQEFFDAGDRLRVELARDFGVGGGKLTSKTATSLAWAAGVMPSGMVRRRAMPPEPRTPHLTLRDI